MHIGVLALQGAVREHIHILRRLGTQVSPVKTVEQFQVVDGLIIPGGESTAIWKLINQVELAEPIRVAHQQGLPIFGTCAGLILLAKEIVGTDQSGRLGLLDIQVQRNAFGRQRDSFEASLPIRGVAEDFRAVFIRAPIIEQVEESVEILATIDDKVVAVKQDHVLGASFHPELTDDTRLHAYFIDLVRQSMVAKC